MVHFFTCFKFQLKCNNKSVITTPIHDQFHLRLNFVVFLADAAIFHLIVEAKKKIKIKNAE